ncbi:type II toxin-antitoxin system RelB/DinJ family antitoxin [Pediococcus argentinicus]|uniref:type II toxin-antitoxin system RelB/DinJ family antitoxin n=1 Tax=Pediococcus argentinicus TaxID=480391 RepID=UPI00338F8E89
MDIKPKVRINVNVDKDDKEMATKLFNEMGLNMNTAINMFIKQTIKERGLPFKPKAQTKLD